MSRREILPAVGAVSPLAVVSPAPADAAVLGGTGAAASPTPPVQGTAAENKEMQTFMKQTNECRNAG